MTKGEILDELRCASCDKKLSEEQSLFDTAWLGIYWCGSSDCAYDILDSQCEELDPDDENNREDE